MEENKIKFKRGIIQKYIMPFSVSDVTGSHWVAMDSLKLVHIEQAMEAYSAALQKELDQAKELIKECYDEFNSWHSTLHSGFIKKDITTFLAKDKK